jgi:DNA-binding protein YbaB
MSDHKEHISHYTAADIQRYVQGNLSAREMHAMEKAALDDPFLADAIEGMQQAFTEHDESLVTGQLQQLQQEFQNRTASAAKVVAFKPFRYWQAAAAAVVVIITGVWVYSLVTNNSETSEKTIAKTEEVQPRQQVPAPALHDGKEITGSTDSTTPANANATPGQNDKWHNKISGSQPADDVASKNTDKTVSPYRSNKFEQKASASPPQVYSNDLSRRQTDSVKQGMPYTVEAPKPAMRAEEKKEMAPTAAAATETLAKSRKANDSKFDDRERETELITITKNDSTYSYKNAKIRGIGNKDKNLSGFIKGQVTDQRNNPIANAYLQVPNNNNNFYTNKSGFFKIPVADSVVDVAVNVTGYGTQNFRLQNDATMNQLQLQPANAALNEVEITPITSKVKKQATSNKYPNVMVHDAEPVFGWVAFDQYLEKNKKVPAGAPSLTGNILVSFQVNKKGELSDFKIDQSLSKAYDDEAIRLIMQGPTWKLLKGRKARITVMVRF